MEVCQKPKESHSCSNGEVLPHMFVFLKDQIRLS